MRLRYDNGAQLCDYVADAGLPDRADASKDIESAVLSQILSDAQAGPNVTLRDGSGDRRGWCVDDIEPSGRSVGSLLWLAYGGKATPAVRRQLRRDVERSLRVFVDAGIASRATVEVQTIRPDVFGVTVYLHRPDDPSKTLAELWLEVQGVTYAVS